MNETFSNRIHFKIWNFNFLLGNSLRTNTHKKYISIYFYSSLIFLFFSFFYFCFNAYSRFVQLKRRKTQTNLITFEATLCCDKLKQWVKNEKWQVLHRIVLGEVFLFHEIVDFKRNLLKNRRFGKENGKNITTIERKKSI